MISTAQKMNSKYTQAELLEKLVAMLRLEHSAPFDMLLALARQRSVWIEAHIPSHEYGQLFSEARAILKKEGAKLNSPDPGGDW